MRVCVCVRVCAWVCVIKLLLLLQECNVSVKDSGKSGPRVMLQRFGLEKERVCVRDRHEEHLRTGLVVPGHGQQSRIRCPYKKK